MLRRALDSLLALAVAPSCVACRAPPASAGELLCGACRRELQFLGDAVCRRCGLPLPCGQKCPAARAPWDGARSAVAYDGPARELVLALKFKGALAVADQMAAALVAAAPADWLERSVLVPAPTTRRRARERGFDQAELLARSLGRRAGLAVEAQLRRSRPASNERGPGAAVNQDPRRAASTISEAHQLGASRAARIAAGRVSVRWASGNGPEKAVLVDDVHTTGATLAACARALRDAGSREIYALSYARTL